MLSERPVMNGFYTTVFTSICLFFSLYFLSLLSLPPFILNDQHDGSVYGLNVHDLMIDVFAILFARTLTSDCLCLV